MRRLTALAFTLSRNRITGEAGLIVRRWIPGDTYSRPIAELLAIPPAITEASRPSAALLTCSALDGSLEIYVEEQPEELNPCPVVFTGIYADDEDEPDTSYLIARRLVREFEVAQWADPLVEARGGWMQ
jgi:hypothetical protein